MLLPNGQVKNKYFCISFLGGWEVGGWGVKAHIDVKGDYAQARA